MSNQYLPVGYVTPSGQDVLPSTGAHLDVRVLDPKTNKYINPETIRSLLTRLKVGPKYTPLWQQKGDDWSAAFPVTSGYGPRSAPTAGASTFHPAHDYGIAGGTQLAWEGPGTFKPGNGYGEIQTTDAQGRPFVVKLLHTKGGKEGGIATNFTASTAKPTQTVSPTGEIINNYFIGGLPDQEGSVNPLGFLSAYKSKRLSAQDLIGLSQQQSSPIEQLMSAISATPKLYG